MESESKPKRVVLQHYMQNQVHNEVILVDPQLTKTDLFHTSLKPNFTLGTTSTHTRDYMVVVSPQQQLDIWHQHYPECASCELFNNKCTQSAYGRYTTDDCPVLHNPQMPVTIFRQAEKNTPFIKQ